MGPVFWTFLAITIALVVAALYAWFVEDADEGAVIFVIFAAVAGFVTLMVSLAHSDDMHQQQQTKDAISTTLHRQYGLNVASVTVTDGNWYATASLTKNPTCSGQVRMVITTNYNGDLTGLTVVNEPACMATTTP